MISEFSAGSDENAVDLEKRARQNGRNGITQRQLRELVGCPRVQVITGVERRRRWSDEQKRAFVAAAFASVQLFRMWQGERTSTPLWFIGGGGSCRDGGFADFHTRLVRQAAVGSADRREKQALAPMESKFRE